VAAERELGQHDHEADKDDGQQVGEDENRAAVLTDHDGEPPDAAQPDGRTRGGEDEGELGAPAAAGFRDDLRHVRLLASE
jgi:hypothetical protein